MLLYKPDVETVTVEVTQDDIDRGLSRKPDNCALALAIRRATGEDWTVFPISGSWIARRWPWLDVYVLPPECAAFGRRFDLEDKVTPFSFTFELRPRTPAAVAAAPGADGA